MGQMNYFYRVGCIQLKVIGTEQFYVARAYVPLGLKNLVKLSLIDSL
jgi:hypothetical protein